jgi:hypothetical protein
MDEGGVFTAPSLSQLMATLTICVHDSNPDVKADDVIVFLRVTNENDFKMSVMPSRRRIEGFDDSITLIALGLSILFLNSWDNLS